MKLTKQIITQTMSLKLFIGLLFLSVGAAQARALGPQTGGGGFAVYCPETPVAKESVELLDLYEGKLEVYGRKYLQADQDLMSTYKKIVQNTYKRQGYPDAYDNNSTEEHLKRFFQSVKFVDKINEMPMANDLGSTIFIPSQCSFAQIAFFADSRDVIYILKPAWDKMDLLNQAALVLHELHGFTLRKIIHVNSSVTARKFTAACLTMDGVKENTKEIFNGLKSLHALSVIPADGQRLVSSFKVLPLTNAVDSLSRLFITSLFGMGLVSETYVDLPLADLQLKFKTADNNRLIYVLVNENIDQIHDLVINGVQTDHLKMRVVLKTGEPVRIFLIEDGVVKFESWIQP